MGLWRWWFPDSWPGAAIKKPPPPWWRSRGGAQQKKLSGLRADQVRESGGCSARSQHWPKEPTRVNRFQILSHHARR
ncbi:hypothetical protein BQ8420_04795 [Nocardiopsis sp. JB363]|nr:hypothetical protein BQ8420_04795 [Nocardiopsis sp. JB363]